MLRFSRPLSEPLEDADASSPTGQLFKQPRHFDAVARLWSKSERDWVRQLLISYFCPLPESGIHFESNLTNGGKMKTTILFLAATLCAGLAGAQSLSIDELAAAVKADYDSVKPTVLPPKGTTQAAAKESVEDHFGIPQFLDTQPLAKAGITQQNVRPWTGYPTLEAAGHSWENGRGYRSA